MTLTQKLSGLRKESQPINLLGNQTGYLKN